MIERHPQYELLPRGLSSGFRDCIDSNRLCSASAEKTKNGFSSILHSLATSYDYDLHIPRATTKNGPALRETLRNPEKQDHIPLQMLVSIAHRFWNAAHWFCHFERCRLKIRQTSCRQTPSTANSRKNCPRLSSLADRVVLALLHTLDSQD